MPVVVCVSTEVYNTGHSGKRFLLPGFSGPNPAAVSLLTEGCQIVERVRGQDAQQLAHIVSQILDTNL